MGINTNEDNVITSKNLLLKDAENKTYVLIANRHPFIRSCTRSILQVEFVINIMTLIFL
jgi:hypothetical protein